MNVDVKICQYKVFEGIAKKIFCKEKIFFPKCASKNTKSVDNSAFSQTN